MKYLVFETEALLNEALDLLENKYRYQILDGRWIAVNPLVMPDNMPAHTLEEEAIDWYSTDSKQYYYLVESLNKSYEKDYDEIDRIYRKLRRSFTNENRRMNITALGQTKLVADAFKDVDYYTSMYSIFESFAALDAIERSSPFLTEERVTDFKTKFYVELVKAGVL